MLLISQDLLAFPYGKWYPDTWNQCLLTNEHNEITVSQGRADRRNTLCDEEKIYINNFFPYVSDNPHRQLGEIFKDHFDDITNEDFGRLKNKIPTREQGDISPMPYVESFLKYLKACKIYITCIDKFIDAPMEEKNADVAVIDNIINKIKNPYNYKLLNSIITDLQNKKTMKRIWDKMHTEDLFVFDRYYNKNKADPQITIPTERICFVSHFDMCENCENLMIKFLEQMEECKSTRFNENSKYSYKILVGSFVQYGKSRERNSESKLLKIKRVLSK